MNPLHRFVERPILACVLSLVLVLLGTLAALRLPITQYPEVAPPTIQVTASYPGATARTVARTVATPLEQAINGVEGMLYLSSQSTGDGNVTVAITFALGTDLDQAQVLVQNRVATAEPRLPEAVRRIGVVTRKASPDLMMVINLFSPDRTYDQLYIANYATRQLRDPLARLDGVGQIRLFGASEYAMRVWLDPDLVDARGLTAGEVVAALRAQNVQVSAGVINEPPSDDARAFQIGVRTRGRLEDPVAFGDVVVRTADDGSVVRLRDVARIELGAQSYTTRGYLSGRPAVAMPLFQRPGSNALETAAEVRGTMAELSRSFPPGLAYDIVYDPTRFIDESVRAVRDTILEAVVLVVLVIVLFLQTWRASVIPVLAIPVSLVGTFLVMDALGFSLNTLTLFGLVLAIGIVVDDAIVVVENVERHMSDGATAANAARRTMSEVGGALVALGLVLVAVFVPAAFVPGISGQFFRQFAATVATATVISVLVSLTLSPALCALLLRPQGRSGARGERRGLRALPARFFAAFDQGLARLARAYEATTRSLVRRVPFVFLAFAILLGLGAWLFVSVPAGFIPAQDQGYAIVSVELPPGAELDRTDAVLQDVQDRILAVDGIAATVGFAGFSGATFTNAPNAATLFTPFDPFEARIPRGQSLQSLLQALRGVAGSVEEAAVRVIQPPPVRGVGNAGGFRMIVEDRRGRGPDLLEDATGDLVTAARQAPGIVGVFSPFEARTPQLFLDIDRVRAEKLFVPLRRIFDTLEIYFGSTFVNDFNTLGRTYRVTAQADAPFRTSPEDLLDLRTRNRLGEAVPLGSVATTELRTAPYRVLRYNLYPAAAVNGDTLPGTSSGEALERMGALAEARLPEGMAFEWTELSYQQQQAGNTGLLVFALGIVFVFLLLAAQFESLTLPLAVILVVPLVLLFALGGVWLTGGDNDLLVQTGLIVLVGLAAKNAILIVEFARQREAAGDDRFRAAETAARLRLRPILMTAFAFILGVVPLVLAEGPGAELRRALGITVFSGMLGVTLVGLLLTPVFYVATRRLARDPEASG